MTDDQFHSLYRAITSCAQQVADLSGHVGGLRESVEQVERRVETLEVTVRRVELHDARRVGHVSATREIAKKAGAEGARRERHRERLITTAISALAVVFSAASYVLPR